jgi:hypothetical protein
MALSGCEALRLLGEEPLPPDAEDRLAALEAAAPRSEAEMFGELWEALIVAAPEPPKESPSEGELGTSGPQEKGGYWLIDSPADPYSRCLNSKNGGTSC